MLDNEDLKWIAASSTELNAIVQQISRYTDLARRHKGEHDYLNLLGERVELASRAAQALFDRVTSKILEGSYVKAKGKGKIKFTVVPPPQGSMTPFHGDGLISRATPSLAELDQAATQNGDPAPEIPSTAQIKNPNGNREMLLVIEDEPAVAEMAAEMLAEEGYKVIIAHDGFEALKIYQSAGKKIGLVLLDFFLPVIDGDAVFDELRAVNPGINVVLTSGFAEQSKIASMLARGLRGFIPKPYTRAKLLEQVRSTLDAARQSAG
jgi:CheY-like chemotaxis protein